MALKGAYRAKLGQPVPDELIAKAIREHGDRGLGALTVAAEWTLAGPPMPERSPEGRQPGPRRRRTTRRARSPSRRTTAGDGDPEHDPVGRAEAAIREHGPRAASWLARELGIRKADALAAVRDPRFERRGGGRSTVWGLAAVRSFDAADLAERWDCDVEMATELVFGCGGFVELGYFERLHGGGRVVLTALGLAASRAWASLAGVVA
jgi:hypothetical protein